MPDRPGIDTGVLDAIRSERAYQEVRWPGKLSVGEEILLAEEYLLEARSEWSLENAPEREALVLLRKVAAIVIRCLEHHGIDCRPDF